MSKGKFYGVGVGPGDPELLTLKARRILENCPVIAAPQTKDRRMLALDIVKGVLDISQKVVLPLKFLMTTDEAALAASHQREAAHVRVLLEEALDVAMINCGDISIYSTFSYLEAIISQAGYDTEAVPGVPSFCAVAAALGTSLTTMQKPLHIIPAGYGNFADHLELEGTKVLMKAGSKLPGVKDTLRKKGLLAKAALVANCGLATQRVYHQLAAAENTEGYFATVLIRG